MKKSINISCSERAKQYPKGTLHADDGRLFCTTCNITLDHTRKGTIDRHLETPSHVNKRKRFDEEAETAKKRQATISGAFKRATEARDSRNVAHFELVEAFTVANIPLYKLDHPKLHEYLQKNVSNLGSLPQSNQLRDHYQPKVFDVLEDELKDKVASATSIVVVTDEASDSQDRFVLHVLFVLPVSNASQNQMDVLTMDLVYLDKVNATTVSQAVLQTLGKYSIDYNIVSALLTDNASYMTSAFQSLKVLLPNCVHITCNAHILSLVGETWRKNFSNVDRLVACFKSAFLHCASRKTRYCDFLQNKTGEDTVPLPPVPVVTRWNSWFKTVKHHAQYVQHYKSFIEKELEISPSTNALTELSMLLQKDQILAEIKFIAESSIPLVELLTWFEGRRVSIHLAYNRIMDLLATFSGRADDTSLPEWQQAAYSDATNKLIQYYCPATSGNLF